MIAGVDATVIAEVGAALRELLFELDAFATSCSVEFICREHPAEGKGVDFTLD